MQDAWSRGDGSSGELPPPPGLEIAVDPLQADDVIGLLQAHLDDMHRLSPPESVHALDLERLRAPSITFWTARLDGRLLGCIALSALDAAHGEIKSMRTVEAARRLGVASALLRVLLQEARRRGYRRLSLETGSQEAFAPARAFYRRFGFAGCAPFGTYVEDPWSVFMTRALD